MRSDFINKHAKEHVIAQEYRQPIPPELPMNVLHGELLSAVSQRRRAFLRAATEEASGGSSMYPQRRGVDYDAMAAQQGDVFEKLSALRATYASRAQKS